jgi:hypothetical protein
VPLGVGVRSFATWCFDSAMILFFVLSYGCFRFANSIAYELGKCALKLGISKIIFPMP